MHDKYRGGHSKPTIELSIGSPMEELEKGPKELKETAGVGGGVEKEEHSSTGNPVLSSMAS